MDFNNANRAGLRYWLGGLYSYLYRHCWNAVDACVKHPVMLCAETCAANSGVINERRISSSYTSLIRAFQCGGNKSNKLV
jgi:hypothetical protein